MKSISTILALSVLAGASNAQTYYYYLCGCDSPTTSYVYPEIVRSTVACVADNAAVGHPCSVDSGGYTSGDEWADCVAATGAITANPTICFQDKGQSFAGKWGGQWTVTAEPEVGSDCESNYETGLVLDEDTENYYNSDNAWGGDGVNIYFADDEYYAVDYTGRGAWRFDPDSADENNMYYHLAMSSDYNTINVHQFGGWDDCATSCTWTLERKAPSTAVECQCDWEGGLYGSTYWATTCDSNIATQCTALSSTYQSYCVGEGAANLETCNDFSTTVNRAAAWSGKYTATSTAADATSGLCTGAAANFWCPAQANSFMWFGTTFGNDGELYYYYPISGVATSTYYPWTMCSDATTCTNFESVIYGQPLNPTSATAAVSSIDGAAVAVAYSAMSGSTAATLSFTPANAVNSIVYTCVSGACSRGAFVAGSAPSTCTQDIADGASAVTTSVVSILTAMAVALYMSRQD